MGAKDKKNKEKQYPVGGQALIEGVMMRGKDAYSIALLKKDGEVDVKRFEHKAISEKIKFFKVPFVRGIGALVDSMKIGIKSLMYSANEALKEEEAINPPKKAKSKKTEKAQNTLLGIVSIVFAFGLFVAVPNVVVHLFGLVEAQKPILFNIVSGVLRIFMFIIYVSLISLMKDVRRVFQFHGAEHKAVNAYEAGKPVDLETVKTFTTFHPRCGTSFMFFVLLIAILIFSFVPILFMAIFPGFLGINVILRKTILILSHILLLPLVAGLSYELIRLTFKGKNNIFIKILSSPGYGIQKITTREPDENQLKCAIAAINEVIQDKKKSGESEEAA